MTVLEFADKTSTPANCPLPTGMEKMSKAEKLDYLNKISSTVVDAFVFQSSVELNDLVNGVLSEEERDILQRQ